MYHRALVPAMTCIHLFDQIALPTHLLTDLPTDLSIVLSTVLAVPHCRQTTGAVSETSHTLHHHGTLSFVEFQ